MLLGESEGALPAGNMEDNELLVAALALTELPETFNGVPDVAVTCCGERPSDTRDGRLPLCSYVDANLHLWLDSKSSLCRRVEQTSNSEAISGGHPGPPEQVTRVIDLPPVEANAAGEQGTMKHTWREKNCRQESSTVCRGRGDDKLMGGAPWLWSRSASAGGERRL